MPAPIIANLALAIELAKYLRPGAYIDVPGHGRVTRVPRGVTLCTREGRPVKLTGLDRVNVYVLMDAFMREQERYARRFAERKFRWGQLRLLSSTTRDSLGRVVEAISDYTEDPAWAKAYSEGWRPPYRAWNDPPWPCAQLPPPVYRDVPDALRDALLAIQPLSAAVCASHKLDAVSENWRHHRTADRDFCWSERSEPFMRAGVTPWSPVCTALRRKNVERYIYDPRLETSPSESRACTVHGMRPLNTVACKVREGRPYQRRCWFGVAGTVWFSATCATIWARVEPLPDLQALCPDYRRRGLRRHNPRDLDAPPGNWITHDPESTWVPRRVRCRFDAAKVLHVPCVDLDKPGSMPIGNGLRCTASRPRAWAASLRIQGALS